MSQFRSNLSIYKFFCGYTYMDISSDDDVEISKGTVEKSW